MNINVVRRLELSPQSVLLFEWRSLRSPVGWMPRALILSHGIQSINCLTRFKRKSFSLSTHPSVNHSLHSICSAYGQQTDIPFERSEVSATPVAHHILEAIASASPPQWVFSPHSSLNIYYTQRSVNTLKHTLTSVSTLRTEKLIFNSKYVGFEWLIASD